MRDFNTVLRKFALFLLVLAPALWVAPRSAFAVGEQNGRVEGIVTDAQSGVPVPGATIKVKGKSLIGNGRSINTDDNGRYELVELPPGTYDLELSYEGVRPIRRRFIVRQGETVPLNIKWSVEFAQQETTVVVEERHLTNPDTTQTGTVLTLDSESKVASGRRYQDVVLQVAGVSGDQNQGNPVVKGATLLHNRYLVDGLDITDPVSNTFSANINFDSIASIEVLTGGFEAQYNSLGGIINLITTAGSNDWHVDTSFYINNAKLSAAPKFGSSLYDFRRPFSVVQGGPQQAYLASLNVGGPLVKNRLWFNLSFEYNYRENSIPAGPPLNVQHPGRYSSRYLARLKLTYAPSEKHRLTLSASADPAFFNNVVQSNSRLGVAEDYQGQGGIFAIVQWDYFASQKVNTNIQAGFQWSTLYGGPQGQFGSVDTSGYAGNTLFSAENNMYDPNRAQHVNNRDGTVWYQGDTIFHDTRYTAQFDPSLSVRGRGAGYHDAKFGIQSRFIYHNFNQSIPGNAIFTDDAGPATVNGTPVLDGGLCVPVAGTPDQFSGGCSQLTKYQDYSQHQYGFGIGLFAQDKWRPTKWLTILPGLRFDWGQSYNSLGERVSNLFGFGPRLGFLFDLTRDSKTILSASYGRSNETTSLLAASSADQTPVFPTYNYNPATKKFDQLANSVGGPGGYKIDTGNTTPPHSDEVTLSMRREVFTGSVVTVDYTYKRLSNVWDGIEINQIWDPTGTRVVGFANNTAQQVFFYTTPDANVRNYHGMDVILESSPGKHLDVLAVYTLSFLYGAGAEQLGAITSQASSQFYNPRQFQFFDGFLPEDHRHQIKVRLSYNWHGLTGGINFGYLSGAPLTKLYFNGNDTIYGNYTLRRTAQGLEQTTPLNNPTTAAEFRTPDLITTDVRLQYDFHELIRQHLTVIVDLFNLFNLGTPTNNGFGPRAIEQTDIPTFGTVQNRQTPFQAQFGLRYTY